MLASKIFSEPLMHFTIIGIALALLYQGVSPDSRMDRVVVVSDETVVLVSQRYAAVWMRSPPAAELEALIDKYIRDEILYREGVDLGLDLNDRVIQQRVLQKLEVFSEESGGLTAPSDAELNGYLRNNAARYSNPPILDYQQVMFDPARHSGSLEADFDDALRKLNAGANPASVGDSSLLPTSATGVSLDRLVRDFGNDFATAALALPVGSWQGPVRSGFGVHIVRVERKTAGQDARLTDVRAEVERDWENERRLKARESYYQSLLKEYDVRIETSRPDAGVDQAQ